MRARLCDSETGGHEGMPIPAVVEVSVSEAVFLSEGGASLALGLGLPLKEVAEHPAAQPGHADHRAGEAPEAEAEVELPPLQATSASFIASL
jgi:hypothetical protein